MKIIANRKELLSAAQDAQTVAPDKSPLDVLECTYLPESVKFIDTQRL